MKSTRTKILVALAVLGVIALIVAMPNLAFAQTLPPGATPAPASQIQAIAILLAILPLVSGEIAQVVKTGKLLFWQVPVSWEPYCPPVLGFLGAFGSALALGASIQSALLLGLGGIAAGYGVGRMHNASANAQPVGMRQTAYRGQVPKDPPSRPSAGGGVGGGAGAGLLVGGALVTLAIGLAVLPGCSAMQALFGSHVPADVSDVYSCVVGEVNAGDTKLLTIEEKCAGPEAALILDIVDTLTKSPAFAADHPAAVGALRPQVAARRAAADAGAGQ
jgi:hypothetical protein